MAEALREALTGELAVAPRTQPEALHELTPRAIARQWSTLLQAMEP